MTPIHILSWLACVWVFSKVLDTVKPQLRWIGYGVIWLMERAGKLTNRFRKPSDIKPVRKLFR